MSWNLLGNAGNDGIVPCYGFWFHPGIRQAWQEHRQAQELEEMKVSAPLHKHPNFVWRSRQQPPTLWQTLVGQTHRKRPDVQKDRRQEKGATEDEMVGWHHQLNGHEFEQTLGDSEGQGSLACWSPWSCKESDTSEQLNNKKFLHSFPNHLRENHKGMF